MYHNNIILDRIYRACDSNQSRRIETIPLDRRRRAQTYVVEWKFPRTARLGVYTGSLPTLASPPFDLVNNNYYRTLSPFSSTLLLSDIIYIVIITTFRYARVTIMIFMQWYVADGVPRKNRIFFFFFFFEIFLPWLVVCPRA